MKISISKEKIKPILAEALRILPITLVVVLVVTFLVLTYMSLMPKEDETVRALGEARVKALDIRFNKKILSEIAGTAQPTTVGVSGGRDPFSPF